MGFTGRLDDDRLLAAAMEADQRRGIFLRPAILAAEHHGVGGDDRQMADRELVQRRRQAMLLENIAGRPSFLATRRRESEHQIEQVGGEMRAMMSWLQKK